MESLRVAFLTSLVACSAVPRDEPAPLAPEPAPPGARSAPAQDAADDEFSKLLVGMGVRFLARDGHLEVDGRVNMQSGLVEVLACAPMGKTHEALLVLDCVPSGLQAGLLALGLEPGTPVASGAGGSFAPPTGAPVVIELRWRDAGGVERLARAEDWVWDLGRDSSMPRAPWIFAGSFLQPVSADSQALSFAADHVKSLAVTYHDATAILENPNSGGFDDTVYYVNEKAVPPVGTPVTAVFRPAR